MKRKEEKKKKEKRYLLNEIKKLLGKTAEFT